MNQLKITMFNTSSFKYCPPVLSWFKKRISIHNDRIISTINHRYGSYKPTYLTSWGTTLYLVYQRVDPMKNDHFPMVFQFSHGFPKGFPMVFLWFSSVFPLLQHLDPSFPLHSARPSVVSEARPAAAAAAPAWA